MEGGAGFIVLKNRKKREKMSTDRVINYVVCEMNEEMKGDFQKQVNTVMEPGHIGVKRTKRKPKAAAAKPLLPSSLIRLDATTVLRTCNCCAK